MSCPIDPKRTKVAVDSVKDCITFNLDKDSNNIVVNKESGENISNSGPSKKLQISPDLESLVNSKWTLRAILGDEYTNEIPNCKVVIGTILKRQETSSLLSKLLPLPKSLDHLKRIQSKDGELQIIVTSCDPLEKEDEKTQIEEAQKKLLEISNGNDEYFKGIDLNSFRVIQVPSITPSTKAQFNSIRNLWPCSFHQDKYIEILLTKNAGFPPAQMQIIKENFSQLLEKSERFGGRPACLIVDPDESVLVSAVGIPKEEDPIKHCAMLAVDGIAKLHGGARSFSQKEDDSGLVEVNFSGRVRNEFRDYLCTGLDAYLSNEPCLMCAMGLLHSRVKRIFYIHGSPRVGVLGSLLKLHTLPNINHRFQVFKLEFL